MTQTHIARRTFHQLIVAALLGAVLATPSRAEDTSVTFQPETAFNIQIWAKNMLVRLYVNGAPLVQHARLDEMLFTYPITRYLRDGENTITLDFEPVDPDLRSYTPNPDVQTYVKLTREGDAQTSGQIDLFSGRVDPETNELAATEVGVFDGQPLVTQAAGMTAPARLSLAFVDMNHLGRESSEFARRLELNFTITEPTMPPLPQDGAVVLEDSADLRRELQAAYAQFHGAVQRRDLDLYRQLMDAPLRKVALELGYGDDTGALLQSIFEFSPFGGPEGSSLRALAPNFREAHLSWGADRRMVAVTDAPVSFLNAEGTRIGVYEVFFCRQPDGPLYICHQQDIPY